MATPRITLQEYGRALLETSGEFAKNVPGAPVASALGTVAGVFLERETRNAALENEQKTQEQLQRAIAEAHKNGDKERIERLKKIAIGDNFDVSGFEELTSTPSAREIVAGGGELALIASTGFKPFLKTGRLLSGKQLQQATRVYRGIKGAAAAEKLANAGKLEKFARSVALPVAREAAIGAGFFGLTKAAEKDVKVDDIIKAAEKGAIISGAVTLGAIGAGAALGHLKRHEIPIAKKKIRQGVEKLERIAQGEQAQPAQTQLEQTLSYIGKPEKTLRQKAAGLALKGVEAGRKAQMRFFDRFAPLHRVEEKLERTLGRPLTEAEKIYRDARMVQSVADAKAEQYVDDLLGKLQPYKDIEDKSRAYLLQLDFLDRARLGQKTPGGQSLDDIERGLKRLVQELSPDDMRRAGEVRKIIRKYHTGLLYERISSGLISEKQVGALLKTHPNYIPHNVMLDMDDQAIQALSGSLNVPKTDIMKAVGSIRNIDDPFVATIQRTPIATRVMEKNRVLTNVVQAQEANNIIPGMKRLTEALEAEKGFGTITFFRNGTKEFWQVPEDIAIAVRNLDTPLSPHWWKLLTTPNKVLRKGATQYNLSFSLPNKFRDEQTAALTARAFIEEMAQKAGVSPQSIIMDEKELIKLYKLSGGYGASIFREMNEEQIFKELSRKGVARRLPNTNPLTLIRHINDELEQSTRLRVFRTGLERGLSPKDAAFASRNATVDFAKMGTWMRPLNQAIPFLNARVQGFLNLPHALIANSEAFARMQLYTSVYPALLLHQHNRRFESSKDISQHLKDRYWVIVTGEVTAPDPYTGEVKKFPQFITINKGEGQQLVANPIQWYLNRADGTDFRKISEMIADVIGSASPLEFQSWDQTNRKMTLLSQFGPLTTIPAGLQTNVHPFFGSNIVPENRLKASPELQAARRNPLILKELGKIMKVSPAKVDFIISSFGGFPQDVVRMLDLVLFDGRVKDKSISKTTWGALAETPVIRRFLRETTDFRSPERVMREKQKLRLETEFVVDPRIRAQEKAEEIWPELIKRKTKEERAQFLNSFGDELTPDIQKQLLNMTKRKQTIEALSPHDPIELRARYILLRLDEMKKKNISLEDRKQFLRSLEEEKILTKETQRRIRQIQTMNSGL